MMRIALLCLACVFLAGCAEAIQGPRVVPYTADQFYVRHVPLTDSRSSVEQLAGAICSETGRQATLINADQFTWSIRDATYQCVSIPAEPEASG